MNNLTAKQKKFAELIAGGNTYAEAFREAYDCAGSKPATIRTDASRLAGHPKIREYLRELERLKRLASLDPREAKALALLGQLKGVGSDREKLKAGGKLIRLI
ncbi:MAG: hypothetical protein ACJ746_29110 [Bryobacteraceae bacterium]